MRCGPTWSAKLTTTLTGIALAFTLTGMAIDTPAQTGEQVTAQMSEAVAAHYLVKHDFLQCFSKGWFSDMTQATKIFARNHFVYSRNFIKYLETAASKIAEDDIKAPILENIGEEKGGYEEKDLVTMEGSGLKREWFDKKAHKLLSERFLKALEIDITTVSMDSPGGRFTTFMIDSLKKSTACEALAILGFAIEETVSTLYQYIWDGLKKTDLTPDQIVFFPLHILVDDGHADLLQQGFRSYLKTQPDTCVNASAIVKNIMDRRTQMFDEVRAEIEAAGGACSLPARATALSAAQSNDPNQVVAQISEAVGSNYLVKHDFLQCFSHGGFPDMLGATRVFARNHFVYSRNFIKYLETAAAKIEDEAVKAPILENIGEENGGYEESDLVTMEGHGIKREWFDKLRHKILSERFLQALDIDISTVSTDSPGGRFTTFMIESLQQATACEALAILGFAIEETVSTLYMYIWNGLKKTRLTTEQIVFFPLHILVDDGHADLLKQGFKSYLRDAPETCRNAGTVVKNIMDRRTLMFDEVRAEIEAGGVKGCSIPSHDSVVSLRSRQISEAVAQDYFQTHDFLQCFSNGFFPSMMDATRVFARSHFTYSRNFAKYVEIAAGKIGDKNLRTPILENIVQHESGYLEKDIIPKGKELVDSDGRGIRRSWFEHKSHKLLAQKFLKAVDVDMTTISSDSPGELFTKYMIKTLEQATACEALAVIAWVIEETKPTMYQHIWDGLLKTSLNPEQVVFFPLHIMADEGHGALLKNAFEHYQNTEPETCANAEALVKAVLKRRSEMLDEVRGEVEATGGVGCSIPKRSQRVVAQISEDVSKDYLVKHDFLQCYSNGEFPDMLEATQIFARNHFVYSRNFIKYLETAASKIEDATIKAPILENIGEENGGYEEKDLLAMEEHGIKREWFDKLPHKRLSERFLQSLSIDIKSVGMDSPGGRFTTYMIESLQRATACEALAVLGFAIEETVSTLYMYIWNGLKKTSLTTEQFVFFPLHILVDDGHADLLQQGFEKFLHSEPETCANASAIVKGIMHRRSQMFDEVRMAIEAASGNATRCSIPPRHDAARIEAQCARQPKGKEGSSQCAA